MSAWEGLRHGFGIALTLPHLAYALLGAALGTAVGVLPGIGPAMTISLLLPVTFGVEPTGALILFAGIYYGAMYGGSTTSILLNAPGESATVVTAVEGYQMARRGRGGAALATAAIGSFVAGNIGTLLLAVAGPRLAQGALWLGPAEYFGLIVVAFVAVAASTSNVPAKSGLALCIGLTIGAIGIDAQTGRSRLTFGIPQLLDGIDIVVVAVGLFAIGEILYAAWSGAEMVDAVVVERGRLGLSRADWRRSWPAWLRGTAIGFPIGAIPAGGAEIPTLLSYALERRLTKYPEEFGQGAIEGVAGPEAANNASAAGTLVPLLALGLPTTATAAMILAAFQQFGLQPGPLLFRDAPDLVWGLVASLLIGNAMLVLLNLPLVGIWVRLLKVPGPLLNAGVLVLSTVGTFAMHRSVVDVAILFAIGWLGFLLRRFAVPLVPVIVGAILGPLAEQHLERALAVADGHWIALLQRPGSAALLALAAAIALWSIRRTRRGTTVSSYDPIGRA
ncbi:MAG: tripartite tricarboxylate transporter permease [Gemmatimonadaceae bacterium]